MDYEIIETMPTKYEEMCTLRDYISGMDLLFDRESVITRYHKDASVTMSPKKKGIVLSGLVANTKGTWLQNK